MKRPIAECPHFAFCVCTSYLIVTVFDMTVFDVTVFDVTVFGHFSKIREIL